MRKGVVQLFSGNVVGKLAGFLREVIIAALFGTGIAVGAYRIAQTITLIPATFFTTDTLNAGFVPLYRRFLREDQNKANVLFWLLVVLLGSLAIIAFAALWFGSKIWVAVLAPGFDQDSARIAVELVQVMSLGVPFLILGVLFMYLEMGNNGYILASARSTVQSVGLIIGTLLAFYLKSPVFLAWGFTGAYMLFLLWGILRSLQMKWLRWPSVWSTRQARDVLGMLWSTLRALLLLPFIREGGIIIERIVASLIGGATVAALDYASFITDTAILFLAVPLGTVGLSKFSVISKRDLDHRLNELLPLLLTISIPLAAFVGFNATTIVRIIFERGAFNIDSATVTAQILTGLSLGFWAEILGYVFIKTLNAQLRNFEAMCYMAVAVIASVLVNLLLYKTLGPITLGIAASTYGITIGVLSTRALGLLRQFIVYTGWLAIGTMGYAAISLGFPHFVSIWLQLIFIGVIFVLYWGLYIFSIKPLRAAVNYLFMRLLKRAD